MPQFLRKITRVPSAGWRINRRHWLARDLAFVHSGTRAYIWGEPVADAMRDPLRVNALDGGKWPAHANAPGWVPDGTNYSFWDLPAAVVQPLTISGWWYGVASTSTDRIISLRRSSAQSGGFSLSRSSTELPRVDVTTDSGSLVGANVVGYTFASSEWVQGVATFVSDTDRNAYANGAAKGSNTTSASGSTSASRFAVGVNATNTEVITTTAINGVALPMLIARALSDAEVARLYAEQLDNPWVLFEAPRIWVPMSSGGSTYNVSLSESASPTDDASAVAAWARSLSESASPTDTPSSTIVALVAVSESAAATDAVSTGAAAYDVSVSEAASAADAVSTIAALVASASESLAAADAFTATGVFGAAVSEAASATDATNWGGAIYSVDLAETATLADAVSAALQALAASSEAGNATDAVTVLVSGGVAAVEAAAAADAVSTTAQLVAALSESASAADAVSSSASGDMLGELVEAASATDAYVVAVVRGIAIITRRPRSAITSGAVRPANLSGRGR